MNQSNNLTRLRNKLSDNSPGKWPGLLCGTDGEGSEDPGVHPPDEGHGAGHDLLPLVLGVLPDSLPGLLAGLQAGVTPDVLNIKTINLSLIFPPLSRYYLNLV